MRRAHLSSSAKKKKSTKKIRRFSGTHTYLFKIWYGRAEIGNFIGHVNNTLVCQASFLAADIRMCVRMYVYSLLDLCKKSQYTK